MEKISLKRFISRDSKMNWMQLTDLNIIYFMDSKKEFLIFPNDYLLNKTKIWLDDLREKPDNSFTHLKTFEEFKNSLDTYGLPNYISFDHDLGLGKTGYDCAKYLVEYCLDNKLQLPEYNVHSQNPVGRENIEKLLENFNKLNH